MKAIAIIKQIPTIITRHGGKTALILQKHSPEILTGVGIAGGVGAAIMACKATRKVDDILDHHEYMMAQIAHADDTKETQKAKTKRTIETGMEIVKLYAPPLALGAASIGCILGGHNILNKRNAAIAAAYSIVQDRFNEYRARVVDEFGVDKDLDLFHGTTTKQITVDTVDENGKKKKEKKTVHIQDPNRISQYARYFDDASNQWQKTPEYNLIFLKSQQNYMNDLLHARGHVFLNEVYDALGIPRSKAGAVVGWIISDEGDNFIDFGIYDIQNQEKMDFVNGYEQNILLDFNVDGVIYDLI